MKTDSAFSLLETEMALEMFTRKAKARITLHHLSTGLDKTEGCPRKTGATTIRQEDFKLHKSRLGST